MLGTLNFLEHFEIKLGFGEVWILGTQTTTYQTHHQRPGIKHRLNALTRRKGKS